MKRGLLFFAVALGATCGCAGYTHETPPGPRPPPRPWQPAHELRVRLPSENAGQVVLDGRGGLSPDQAALLAIAHNPRLVSARAERGIGRAELVKAGIVPNPRLSGSVDFPLGGGEAQKLGPGYGAGLTWNVTPLLSRGARRSAARENLASIDLDVAWQEWQVAESARLHTVRAIYLERRVKLARELEKTWSQRLAALRGARATGAVTELEVTNAERSLGDARVARFGLQEELVRERASLAAALGVDPTRRVTLDDAFQPRTELPARAKALAELPRRRLDLIALQRASRSHDQALRAAVLAEFPPIEIGVHAEHDVEQATSAGASLRIEIPLFDRNQGAVLRERARRAKVDAEYTARLNTARANVVSLYAEIAVVREQLGAARGASKAAVDLASQARSAAVSGALNPLIAADIVDRSYKSRLRALSIEQHLAELRIALAVASGIDVR